MIGGSTWPETAEGMEIHARLCEGDPVASADLAEAFLEPLATWLLRTNRSVDSHICEQAAEDAILTLIKSPHTYRPDRGSLDAYLRMSAKGDLRNLMERERRHSSRRVEIGAVEHLPSVRNERQTSTDPALVYERQEDSAAPWVRRLVAQMEASLTEQEKGVLHLMHEGERRTSVFAQVLGIEQLSEMEQRQAVKRVKDRLKRRFERARNR